MFLSINKKKLKELSNSQITLSATFQVKGAGNTDDTNTSRPSKTVTLARCAVVNRQNVSA